MSMCQCVNVSFLPKSGSCKSDAFLLCCAKMKPLTPNGLSLNVDMKQYMKSVTGGKR
jgi:hypothetical protein